MECKHVFGLVINQALFIYYLSDVTVLSKYLNTLRKLSKLLVRDIVGLLILDYMSDRQLMTSRISENFFVENEVFILIFVFIFLHRNLGQNVNNTDKDEREDKDEEHFKGLESKDPKHH